jgi:2,3-dihydroxyphenylpropionate 1,2-dioxygenase
MTTSLVCASHSPLLYCYAKQPTDWDLMQKAYADRVEAVKTFDPELVIAFGSDHFNGFFLKLMPAFCIGIKATAAGDIGGFAGKLNVPSANAIEIINHLRQNDIDPATSIDMTIDHAFSQTIHTMCGDLQSKSVIPVFINCIAEPFVPFRRSRLMGEAIGKFIKTTKKRVLLLASGGLSHHPTRYYPEINDGPEEVTAWQKSGGDDAESLTQREWIQRLETMHHEGAEMIAKGERTAKDMRLNKEADMRFIETLTKFELDDFDTWDQTKLIEEAGIGSMELHTWIAAAAAHKAAGGDKPKLDFYSVAPEIGIAAGIVHGD